jgi:hypothetical protein
MHPGIARRFLIYFAKSVNAGRVHEVVYAPVIISVGTAKMGLCDKTFKFLGGLQIPFLCCDLVVDQLLSPDCRSPSGPM